MTERKYVAKYTNWIMILLVVTIMVGITKIKLHTNVLVSPVNMSTATYKRESVRIFFSFTVLLLLFVVYYTIFYRKSQESSLLKQKRGMSYQTSFDDGYHSFDYVIIPTR